MHPKLYEILTHKEGSLDNEMLAKYLSGELDDADRNALEKQFYAYLSDVFVETMKGFTLKEKELRKHITFGEFPDLTDSNGKDRSCIY